MAAPTSIDPFTPMQMFPQSIQVCFKQSLENYAQGLPSKLDLLRANIRINQTQIDTIHENITPLEKRFNVLTEGGATLLDQLNPKLVSLGAEISLYRAQCQRLKDQQNQDLLQIEIYQKQIEDCAHPFKPQKRPAEQAIEETSARKTLRCDFSNLKSLADHSKEWQISDFEQIQREGFDVNQADDKGIFPIIWAACRGNLAFLTFLLSKGVSPNAIDMAGNTPLNIIAKHPGSSSIEMLTNYNMVSELLKISSIDVNANGSNGHSPLLDFCLKSDFNTASLLLEKRARLNSSELAFIQTLPEETRCTILSFINKKSLT